MVEKLSPSRKVGGIGEMSVDRSAGGILVTARFRWSSDANAEIASDLLADLYEHALYQSVPAIRVSPTGNVPGGYEVKIKW